MRLELSSSTLGDSSKTELLILSTYLHDKILSYSYKYPLTSYKTKNPYKSKSKNDFCALSKGIDFLV